MIVNLLVHSSKKVYEVECSGSDTVEEFLIKHYEQNVIGRKIRFNEAIKERVDIHIFEDHQVETAVSRIVSVEIYRLALNASELTELVIKKLKLTREQPDSCLMYVTTLKAYDGEHIHPHQPLCNESIFDVSDEGTLEIAVRKYDTDKCDPHYITRNLGRRHDSKPSSLFKAPVGDGFLYSSDHYNAVFSTVCRKRYKCGYERHKWFEYNLTLADKNVQRGHTLTLWWC